MGILTDRQMSMYLPSVVWLGEGGLDRQTERFPYISQILYVCGGEGRLWVIIHVLKQFFTQQSIIGITCFPALR